MAATGHREVDLEEDKRAYASNLACQCVLQEAPPKHVVTIPVLIHLRFRCLDGRNAHNDVFGYCQAESDFIR